MTKMKLLMHMCCAPCSVYPLNVLRDEGFNPEGLFFNPNIHPMEEYLKRKEGVEKFSLARDIAVNYIDGFQQEIWENYTGDPAERCSMCYDMRLEKAALYASANGFEAFTTSLLVSPYQKHELIKELGHKYSEKYSVEFVYRDFRQGFRQGQQEARDMQLYRQKYCGCIISKGYK